MHRTIPTSSAPYAEGSPVTGAQVHKSDPAERLLTEWHRNGEDAYVIRARWPQDHGFYAPRHDLLDPLLLAESVRQCVPLLSHAAYGVPFGHRQSWSHFGYTLDLGALATDAMSTPDLELHVACRDVVRRSERLASLNMEVVVMRDGVRVGTARTRFANHAPALYKRLRGSYADVGEATAHALPLPPPVAPSLVARDAFADVVLSPTNSARRTLLRVDLGHPVLFDHPVDHAPGMLLLEAARQSAHAAVHPVPVCAVAMDVVFARYTELDAPCWIHTDLMPADRADEHRVLITAVQRDICVFSAITTLRRLPAG
ncbi:MULTISPECIES: ScbA/BarX family gamma-butyrolactone biosynthesis protein [Streptomyces]|uniref:ScbA/BarX family gamma-butyrolactone biosynthesis protein n=1 Tax=Streptomyces lienomycini TaxID=284035 RepID=A0ABV9X7G6_9ACTN|nr:ScbA/BarX family gamma-butyrolactone biosynthesis protein [Streptomyces sp. NBC_00334]